VQDRPCSAAAVVIAITMLFQCQIKVAAFTHIVALILQFQHIQIRHYFFLLPRRKKKIFFVREKNRIPIF
jgi:hypothetical protein